MFSRSLLSSRALCAGEALAPLKSGAPFSTTRSVLLKESSGQTDAEYEKHKQDSLRKQEAGKGEWKRELSSDSEEAVKADREPRSQENIKKLQEQTKKAADAEKGK